MNSENREHEAVSNFRKYLRIKSVHPNINYEECVKFVRELANGLGLPVNVLEVHPGKPVVIITVVGTNPELPSLMLNSHMDVVPVFSELWTHEPFAAEKDINGNIYARGAQDMKCIGIQYVEAIRRYHAEGLKFKRTIHITFVPEEELGGDLGMRKFVQTKEFRKLNVGFSLDEGIPSPDEEFLLFFAERYVWVVKIVSQGNTGHGSIIHENTAAEKLLYVINKLLALREIEKQKLKSNTKLALGDVTTVNLTILKGGVQSNVLPSILTAEFDVRIAQDVNLETFGETIRQWGEEAGPGVEIIIRRKEDGKVEPTKLDNPWCQAFKKECDKMKLKLKPLVFPASTDGAYLREIGIPVLGFSPINNTPVLLHDHNEFLNEKVFLRGIDIYYNIIKSLANV